MNVPPNKELPNHHRFASIVRYFNFYLFFFHFTSLPSNHRKAIYRHSECIRRCVNLLFRWNTDSEITISFTLINNVNSWAHATTALHGARWRRRPKALVHIQCNRTFIKHLWFHLPSSHRISHQITHRSRLVAIEINRPLFCEKFECKTKNESDENEDDERASVRTCLLPIAWCCWERSGTSGARSK